MEAAGEAKTFIDKIKVPRLEDAGLEDCALPPESIKEAFLKAASAVRSVISASDDEDEDEDESGSRCMEDPWEDSSDALVGVTEGVTAPSGGCVVEKGGSETEAPGDKVVVCGGDAGKKSDAVVGPVLPEGGEACVDGLQGLEIGEKDSGIFGKKVGDRKEDVAEDEDEKPILVEGHV